MTGRTHWLHSFPNADIKKRKLPHRLVTSTLLLGQPEDMRKHKVRDPLK